MKKETVKNLDFCNETISKKHVLEMGWLELCARLKEIRDNKLYEGRWENFEDFLNDPSMDMDKGTASKMITIHEKLITEYQIKPVVIANAGGWSKVAELLPVINNKKDAEEWLSKSSVLSKNDLRKEIKEKKGKGGIGCQHPNSYKVVMCCCKNCDYKEVEKYL